MVVIVLLIAVLAWAAAERGRIHHEWTRLRQGIGYKLTRSIDWCFAMAAAAGCA
jgi:hypothetical protein